MSRHWQNKTIVEKNKEAADNKRPVDVSVIQPGSRVVITGFHPWAGYAGVVQQEIDTLVGKMWEVELDNGSKAGCRSHNLKAV